MLIILILFERMAKKGQKLIYFQIMFNGPTGIIYINSRFVPYRHNRDDRHRGHHDHGIEQCIEFVYSTYSNLVRVLNRINTVSHCPLLISDSISVEPFIIDHNVAGYNEHSAMCTI